MAAVDVLILEQARKEVREAIDDMTELNAKIIEIAKNINKFTGKPFTNPIPSDLPKRAKESSKWISDLNAANREAERLASNVARSKARLAAAESNNAKQLARLREETRLNNIALKEEGILSSRLVGAYKKLTVRRNQAARTLKNLIASERASNKEIRRAQREFDRLDAKVRKADRATNDFRRNVGNYSSAFGKASLALRNFVGVLGIYSGFEIARQVFEQVKALNGLNLALEQVTETANAYNEAQQFISDVAEEAGADIFSLTSAYTKFLASAKTTTLTLGQTNNIFRQTAKAAGVLGLSTEDTNGAFRALEQILSKGKVQAEEIRGQLGERLPGAFQILARSMGLTTAELSKQLELGNVLSDEVLPGFAEELERTYNLGLVDRVETLAASQTRLGNAWKQFLANVEGGQGVISTVFKDVFDGITNALNALTEFNKTFGDKKLEGEAKGVSTAITAVKEESEKMNISFKDAAQNIIPRYKKIVGEWGEELHKVTDQQSQSAWTNFMNVISGEWDEQEETAKRAGQQIGMYNKAIETLEKIMETGELPEEMKKVNKELEDQGKKLKDLTPRLEKVFAIMKGSTGQELEKVKKEIAEITEILNSTGGDINVGISGLDTVGVEEMNAALLASVKTTYDTIDDRAKVSAQEQIDIFSNVFDTFSQYYGLDLRSFQNLLQGKEASLQDYVNTAKSIAQTLTDSAIIRYENERVANQQKLDAILADESRTEDQKAEAQERFAKEESKIRVEQAKAQRTATLIQIGIDTAAGIAKAVAASPLTFGMPFAAIVASVGAAQAAFVAAQPLPQFFKGTKDAPEGWAWTDEKGAEIHTDKSGNIKDLGSDDGPRLKMLESGDKIYTASESKNIVKNSILDDNALTQQKIDQWIMQKANPVVVSSDGIKKEIRDGIRQGFKGVKMPEYPDNYSRY